jgi:tRNA nucleotidyltransferase (CCA-adding enzyme)
VRGRLGHGEQAYPQRERLAQALRWAQSGATADGAAQAQVDGLTGPSVGERIYAARVTAIAAGLSPGSAHTA